MTRINLTVASVCALLAVAGCVDRDPVLPGQRLDPREVLSPGGPAIVGANPVSSTALSLDALSSATTCVDSVRCLRRRGRHVQVRLLPPAQGRPLVPMERVVALELEVLGSHGMAAHAFPALLELVAAGRLRPDLLVTREVGLDEAGAALADVGQVPGITVVTPR